MKLARLQPALEAAMKRKKWMHELTDDEIPTFEPLARAIHETQDPREIERRERAQRMREVLREADTG